MKKVMVLGSAGMAGHIMAEYLHSTGDYHVFGVAREDGRHVDKKLDIVNFSGLQHYLNEVKPDFVINCIGVLVSKSADDMGTAIQINSYLPHFLSRLGKGLQFKLVHISTDCVFSGKDGQYHEYSFRDGNDNYARTKALGEVVNDQDLTIRTSIIGPELKRNGTGLLDWFFKQQGEIKGYSRAYWSGVTTLELAKATHEMIKQDITGLYQLCPDEKISKYELLKLFAKVWNKDISVLPYENYAVDKSLLCTRTDFNYPKPDYEAMLIEAHDWMNTHTDYYPHYRLK